MLKILFFRIGAIGDTLLTTAAVHQAKKMFPDAVIHYLAGAQAAPVLENNPDIDKVFYLPKENTLFPKFMRVFLMKKFFKNNFKEHNYDYFIDFESSYYSTYFSMMIKTKNKIGHIIRDRKRKSFNKLYNIRVDYNDGNWYVIKRHLALIKPLGEFEQPDNSIYMHISDEEHKNALKWFEENNINENDKKIMLCVSSTRETKRWPDEHWHELTKKINEQHPDAKIIILTAPGDPENLLSVLKSIHNVYFIPLNGLRFLGAVLSHGNILISNDGAVRHMATALKIKTIGIFGPTNDKGWAFADENNIVLIPDVDCRPCHKPDCTTDINGCMKLTTPEMVLHHIKKFLS